MKPTPRILIILQRAFARLARLYPSAFQEEMAEEMQTTFSDLVEESAVRGGMALGLAILRELRDLPGTLVREYWAAFKTFYLHIDRQDALAGLVRGAQGWAFERKRLWQTGVKLLILVSLAGPWVFELLSVPREFACTPPNVRLEGDFCGTPYWGVLAFPGILAGFPGAIWRILTHPYLLGAEGIYFLPLLIPVFCALLLVWRKGRRPQGSGFKVMAWSWLLGTTLFMGVAGTLSRPVPLLAPWGIWVFSVAAAIALLFEILLLAGGPKQRALT